MTVPKNGHNWVRGVRHKTFPHKGSGGVTPQIYVQVALRKALQWRGTCTVVPALVVALFSSVGCQQMIATPGDSRVVYITPAVTRGTATACIEPATKTPDSYKDVLDVVTKESMSVEALPEEGVVRFGEFKRSINVEEKTQFLRNRIVRIHNMREILFELCQAYANNLIDLDSYSRLLAVVIEKTASLHAMEILLHQLDQRQYDQVTRSRLIKLARDIIFQHSTLIDQTEELEGSAKHGE